MAGIALLAAQSAPAQESIETTGFDIPADVSLMAPMDPDKRKATAKVNGSIITGTDVDHRLALILAANEGVEVPAE